MIGHSGGNFSQIVSPEKPIVTDYFIDLYRNEGNSGQRREAIRQVSPSQELLVRVRVSFRVQKLSYETVVFQEKNTQKFRS